MPVCDLTHEQLPALSGERNARDHVPLSPCGSQEGTWAVALLCESEQLLKPQELMHQCKSPVLNLHTLASA